MQEAKPYSISKKAVIAAYQRVKANKGTYGVDEQSIEDFERKLNNNLYKIWNRMSSGTYFPKPVKAVAIPKKNGGTRILGIPTVEDRIAQMVAKLYLSHAWSQSFMKIPMDIVRTGQPYRRLKPQGQDVGEKTGYWSLISGGCLITSDMIISWKW